MGRKQLLLIGVLAVVLLVGAWQWNQRAQSEAADAATLASVPPEIAMQIQRMSPEARESYIFALQRPDVLAAVPCYCGCASMDHTSNLTCFIKRDAQGRIALEAHGSAWNICTDIAREAKAESKRGFSLAKIRQNIDLLFSKYGPGTKTPLPPEA